MASFINTNIASLNAQRNLASSQSALQTSLQRLSSGLRINSAKDDAAGLAIANRFTTQINGLDQAQRNANDGISLAQTADGALSSISDNLQRIRELAVQAANSTNSASDRAAINEEVQQRLAEIDRTSSQTSFNGQKILDGNFGTASFQVGANAGETINVDLNSSMRTGAIGKIATETTTGAVGATASGGTITTGAITAGDFSKVDALAANSISPATLHFSGTGSNQVNGKNVDSTINTADFDTTTLAAAAGFNAQSFDLGTAGNLDMSGTKLIQFDVTAANVNSGNAIGITLNQNYATSADVVTDIQSQLDAVTGTTNGFVVSYSSGKLSITDRGGAATNALDAVQVSGTDLNAQNLGLADTSGTAGVAANSGLSFDVDGTTVTLNTDYTNGGANSAQQSADAMAADVATQLGSGYTVAIDGTSGAMTITHAGTTAGDTDAVVISNADAAAQSIGIANSTGTAGSLAQSSANAKFMVDGHEITLSSDYASFDALASDLASKINTAASTTTYSASYDSTTGKLNITNSDGAATGVAIAVDTGATSVEQSNATAAGFVAGAGTGPSTSTALSFKVDGTAITLNGNDSTLADVKTELQSKLDAAFGSGAYTAAVSGSGLSITNTVAGSSAVAISDVGTSGNAYNAGFRDATGTAGATGGSVAISNLSITVGSNTTVNIAAKTYASVDDLAAEINKSVGGAYATVSNGKLTLTSASAMTLGGSDATTLGFASTTVAANDGSLDSGDTLTVDNANNLIQRVDSALSSVNSLRSTFGAIQNRFDSVISNLSSTSENLSAARSRIQDADFAAETAALTRGQILQQAGTAMLAQANSLPNNVLSLLR